MGEYIPRKNFIVVDILPREYMFELLRHYMGDPDKSPRIRKGKVRAVGPQVKDIKAGDTILCGQFAGLEIGDRVNIMNGIEPDVRVMRDTEVEAVITEE